MQKILLTKILPGLALLGVATSASADVFCSAPGAHPDNLDVSDVTYSPTGVAPFSDSNDCYGVVDGNVNDASDVNGVWGTGFVLAESTETAGAGSSVLGGLTFTLTGPVNGTTGGTYTLSATDNNGAAAPNFPMSLDFIVALKASNRYALYFFDDAVFDGSGGGAWSIEFVNNGQQIPGLSHMLVFVREGTTRQVPEPAVLSLLGAGFVSIAMLRRRRKQA